MKKLFLIALAAMALTSCQKQITSLPETTQTGANTFGAKIDGSLWGPIGFGIAQTSPILEARITGVNDLIIDARNFGSEPNESVMEICVKDIQKTGTYPFNQTTVEFPNQTASYGYFIKRKINPTGEWITNTNSTGWVNISKLDRDNKIVSGTFEFTGATTLGSDGPISVTEGRFDIKYE